MKPMLNPERDLKDAALEKLAKAYCRRVEPLRLPRVRKFVWRDRVANNVNF